MVNLALYDLNYLKILVSLGYSAEFKIPEELIWNWKYAWNNAGPQKIVHISKMHAETDFIDNFLYHRESGMFMINFESGMHTMMQEAFEALIEKQDYSTIRKTCKADYFISKDRGMLYSSIKDEVIKSATFRLTPQESMVLRRLDLKTQDLHQ